MRPLRFRLAVFCVFTCLGLVAGCQPPKAAAKKKIGAGAWHAQEKGAHGGLLIPWGNQDYLLEVCLDRDAKEATVYVFDRSAAALLPIETPALTMKLNSTDPPVEIRLLPESTSEDPPRSASRFHAKSPAVAGEAGFFGAVSGTVGDTVYQAEFDERGPFTPAADSKK